jgi:hypothetical protein
MDSPTTNGTVEQTAQTDQSAFCFTQHKQSSIITTELLIMSVSRNPRVSGATQMPVNPELTDLLQKTAKYDEIKQVKADLKSALQELAVAKKQLMQVERKWTRKQTQLQQLKASDRRTKKIKYSNTLYQLQCLIHIHETAAEESSRNLERWTIERKLSTGPGWKC